MYRAKHWLPPMGLIAALLLIEVHASGTTTLTQPFTQTLAPTLTIDDILQKKEGMGRAIEGHGGRMVVYEWFAPYDQLPNPEVANTNKTTLPRAKLLAIDTQTPSLRRLLFPQQRNGGYWIGSVSPSGGKLAVYSLVDRKLAAGVYDFSSDKVTWFDFTPNYWAIQARQPLWVDEYSLVFPVVASNLDSPILFRPALAQRLQGYWERTFAGEEVSSTVMESRADEIPANKIQQHSSGARLVMVDARSGSTKTIGTGSFTNLQLSPNRAYVVALKEEQTVQFPPDQLELYDFYSRQREVNIFAVHTGERISIPCENCNIISGSVQWSADSRAVSYFVTPKNRTSAEASVVTYTLRDRKKDHYSLNGFALSSCGGAFGTVIPPLKLSRGIAVYARTLQVGEEPKRAQIRCDQQTRYDWWYLDGIRKPLNLTSQFRRSSGSVLAIKSSSFFVIADNAIWELHFAQKHIKRSDNALAGIATREVATRSDGGLMSSPPLATEIAAWETADSIKWLNIETFVGGAVAKPAGGSLTDLNTVAKSAVFVRGEEPTSELLFAAANRLPKEILVLNADLKQFARSHVMEITYEFAGESVTSCAVLPPSLHPSSAPLSRYPMIVIVYPYSTHKSCLNFAPAEDLDNFSILSQYGYVVLYPTTSERLIRTTEGPLTKLSASIDAAVDHMIAIGFADSNRLGVIGMSQGHHAALQVLTQTNRFKAAVVSNGISSAVSHYGTAPLYVHLLDPYFQVGNAARYELWQESPNGLGAKPWENPLLYIQHSPVFAADKIRTPLLIIHSDFDGFPLGQSEEIFSALYRLKRDATYVIYWGEAHALSSPANIRDMWQRLLGWFSQYVTNQCTTQKPLADACSP